jgi:hypothetical protein
MIMSRAVDDQGTCNPRWRSSGSARSGTDYHFNSIRAWRIARDGTVTFEAAT